jgi:hypothetical protein
MDYWSKRQDVYDILEKIVNRILPKQHVQKESNWPTMGVIRHLHTNPPRMFFVEDTGNLACVEMSRSISVHIRKRFSVEFFQRLQYSICDHWSLDELIMMWLRFYWIKKIINRHYDSIVEHLWRPGGYFAKKAVDNIDQVLSSNAKD